MSEKEKPCMTCKACSLHKDNQLKSWLCDFGGAVFSSVNPRPNSKAHTVVISKDHIKDLREMSLREWNDILPVLKDSIAKIEKIYKPIGYRLNIPTGELAGQNIPYHFYMRIVPKYGLKDKGSTGIKEHYKQATPEQEKEINEALSPDINNIIAKRSKVIAKLRNDKHAGYVTILTKEKISPEVENIDQTTWSEIGEIIKELIKKYETKLNCHDFFIGCNLNIENKKILRQEKGENLQAENFDLCFTIFPKYKIDRWWVPKEGGRPFRNGLPVGTMENERIAEKLRNPEEYAKVWGKKSTPSIRGREEEANSLTKSSLETREKNTEQNNNSKLWLGIGMGVFGLGLIELVVWLIFRKKRVKE